MFPVVIHDNEWEEERVIVFGSQQYVFSEIHFNQIVVMHEQVAAIWVQDDEPKVSLLDKELQTAGLSLG